MKTGKKIFVDLGCYDGDTIRQFMNWGWLRGNPHEYVVYGFDPNPNLHKQWEDVRERFPNVHFQASAAWVTDGEVDFTLQDSPTPLGSTIMPENRNWRDDCVRKTPCFSLSKWLIANVQEDDQCIVKMDIEGAEFAILEDLFTTNAIAFIDTLLVEWHDTKMHPEYTQRKADIIAKLDSFQDNHRHFTWGVWA